MSVAIVVGGQFGSEGKGKMTAHLCRYHNFDIAVRCGGPNSGHTVTIDGKQIVLRQIPAGIVNPSSKLFLAAGCLLDLDVLSSEINLFELTSDRLGIDYNAVIIEKGYNQEENKMALGNRIGSTCTGTGIAVAKRVLRDNNLKLARDIPELKPYLTNVSKEIMKYYSNGKRIIIEGTQGFGLSVYHSPYYPFATSRDTTAAGFLSEVGVSPLLVSDIIMVIRTFPIRVGGNSGPLPREIDWETIQRDSGYPYKIQELTSVTKRLRRVAKFDIKIVEQAVSVNRPTEIALMGADYLEYKNKNAKHFDELTSKTRFFINWLDQKLGAKINFIGIGPTDEELLDKTISKEIVINA